MIQIRLLHACPVTRAGLNAILSAQVDFDVRLDLDCVPDGGRACVVVADYASGIRTARRLSSHQPNQRHRLLVFAAHTSEWEVRHAIDSGVHGFLLQGCEASELVASVRALSLGMCYLDVQASRCIADSLIRLALTKREMDVLRNLAKGSSDKLIARDLGIAPGTVKHHMKNVLGKLGASARTQAVVVAMERGLLAGLDIEVAPAAAQEFLQ